MASSIPQLNGLYPNDFGVNASELQRLQDDMERSLSGKCHFTFQHCNDSQPVSYSYCQADEMFEKSVSFLSFYSNRTDFVIRGLSDIFSKQEPINTTHYKPLQDPFVYLRGKSWNNFDAIKPHFRVRQNSSGEHYVILTNFNIKSEKTREFKFGDLSWEKFDYGASDDGKIIIGNEVMLKAKGGNFTVEIPDAKAKIKFIIRQYHEADASKRKFSKAFPGVQFDNQLTLEVLHINQPDDFVVVDSGNS